jgi:hypothetical protein
LSEGRSGRGGGKEGRREGERKQKDSQNEHTWAHVITASHNWHKGTDRIDFSDRRNISIGFLKRELHIRCLLIFKTKEKRRYKIG